MTKEKSKAPNDIPNGNAAQKIESLYKKNIY